MRQTVEVSGHQVNLALRGVLTQLSASGIAEGYDSLAHALHSLSMWDFVFNQAEVVATHWAWETMYINLIHQKLE